MPGDVDATVKLRTSGGTLVQDLSADNFWVGPVEEPELPWQFNKIDPQYVDGTFRLSGKRSDGVLQFTVRIYGDTWADVIAAKIDLQGWLDPWSYLVEVYADGVSTTYRAAPGNMQPETLSGPVVRNKSRQYAVTVPVQPNPVVTGA